VRAACCNLRLSRREPAQPDRSHFFLLVGYDIFERDFREGDTKFEHLANHASEVPRSTFGHVLQSVGLSAGLRAGACRLG
jgi:hypothetical protein